MLMLNKRILFATVIFILLVNSIFAKAKTKKPKVTDKNYVEEDDEIVFDVENDWQILEWGEDYPEYVSRYEVVIEKYNKKLDSFEQVRLIDTVDNSTQIRLEPLLDVGNYRYKIITYDLLDIPQVESDWFSMEIKKAYLPKISDIASHNTRSSTIYLEEINDGIFNVKGENLFEPLTENSENESIFTEYKLKYLGFGFEPIIPVMLEHQDDNKGFKFQINMENLDVGRYRLIATDASGLKSEKNPESVITIKFKKPVDFDVSGGLTLPIILWDDYYDENEEIFKGTFTDIFNQRVFFGSWNAKAAFMFFKRKYGYIGIGADASYTRMYAHVRKNKYKISGNLINANGLFVFQIPINIAIKNKNSDVPKTKHLLTLELHGGGGATVFGDYKFEFYDDYGNTTVVSDGFSCMDLSIIGGGAVQYYLLNRLFIEANVDFVYALDSGMAGGFGLLLPSINVGWQF